MARRKSRKVARRSKKYDQKEGNNPQSQNPIPQSPTQAANTWIWDQSGQSEDDFLANAYCVDILHGAPEHTDRAQRGEDSSTEELFKRLLDAIALLFARYKPEDKADKRDEDDKGNKEDKENQRKGKNAKQPAIEDASAARSGRHHTSEHVSAAVMRRPDENRRYTIYIAKNTGSRTLNLEGDAARDEEIAGLLQNWFNSKGESENEKFEEGLRSFWKPRIDFYQRSTRGTENASTQERLKRPEAQTQIVEFFTSEENPMKSSNGGPGDPSDNSSATWPEKVPAKSELEEDLKYARTTHENPNKPDPKTIGQQYRLYRQWYMRRKAETPGDPCLGLVEDFIRYIKWTKLENTVPTMMQIFFKFRQRLRDEAAKVRIEGPEDPGEFKVDPYNIQNTVRKWPKTDIRSGEQCRAYEESLSPVIEDLSTLGSKWRAAGRNGAPRNFHCELQLMNRFLDDDEVYSYIGCSKRSCWLCWEILAGSRFITKGTHCRLHWACAYPFNEGSTPARKELVIVFREVMQHIEGARRALVEPASVDATHGHIDGGCIPIPSSRFKTGVAISQTAPLEFGYGKMLDLGMSDQESLHVFLNRGRKT